MTLTVDFNKMNQVRQETQGLPLNDLSAWFPREEREAVASDDTVDESITDLYHYVPENAPYSEYSYENLVKRSTKRLIKMYAKTFSISREEAAKVARYDMIDEIYEELQKYYTVQISQTQRHTDEKTGREFLPGFHPDTLISDYDECMAVKHNSRHWRRQGLPAHIVIGIKAAHAETSMGWTDIANFYADFVLEGYNLRPADVYHICKGNSYKHITIEQ